VDIRKEKFLYFSFVSSLKTVKQKTLKILFFALKTVTYFINKLCGINYSRLKSNKGNLMTCDIVTILKIIKEAIVIKSNFPNRK